MYNCRCGPHFARMGTLSCCSALPLVAGFWTETEQLRILFIMSFQPTREACARSTLPQSNPPTPDESSPPVHGEVSSHAGHKSLRASRNRPTRKACARSTLAHSNPPIPDQSTPPEHGEVSSVAGHKSLRAVV
ncbi:hypothetical protein RR46_10129 [Papilio xuthus]|uniref:Uncharacterized protein n=1 Tax=Papilio xuthus TaxID=66420 RepID=A0A194PZR2_PAPXU|nr:hypothetical protein RR46_10129 [Papilio xuthus]